MLFRSPIAQLSTQSHMLKAAYPIKKVSYAVAPLGLEQYFSFEFLQMAKASPKLRSSISEIAKRFQENKPLIIEGLDTDESKLPLVARKNFTSWFKVLQRRTYENPLIQDLYFLYEVLHIGYMAMAKSQDFTIWSKETNGHELVVSFNTEAMIYFYLPTLRSKTFSDEIWIDRFLNNTIKLNSAYKTNQEFYEKDPVNFEKSLFFYYCRSFYRKSNKARHSTELTLQEYRRKNIYWMQIWKIAYFDVETVIQNYLQGALSQEEYIAWLDKNTSVAGVLFEQAAYAYTLAPSDDTSLHDRIRSEIAFNASQLAIRTCLGKVTMTSLVGPTTLLLQKYGITPTIYSYFSPEIESLCEQAGRKLLSQTLHHNAAERIQDELHVKTISDYERFVSDTVSGLSTFTYKYPSNGSSEGLQLTFAHFKFVNPESQFHVFKGEYEVALQYATHCRYTLYKHNRPFDKNFKDFFAQPHFKSNDFFYLSQPSSLDVNVWEHFDEFCKAAYEKGIRLIVDLAYVGTVAKNYHIDLSHPAIECVLGSLSKIGPYYKRIGFCFTRFEHPLLFGNKWFKNIDSLVTGSSIMTGLKVQSLALKYKEHQELIIEWIKQETQGALHLKPSDSFLVAVVDTEKTDFSQLPKDAFEKVKREHGVYRVCLVTAIAAVEKISRSQNISVSQMRSMLDNDTLQSLISFKSFR